MGEMLSVKNIDVYYGSIHAIKNVSFHVNEGDSQRPYGRARH